MSPTLRALPANEEDEVRAYSVPRLAELWDVSAGWIYKQIRAGDLPVVEFGDRRAKTRVAHPDAVSFLRSRRAG